MSSQVLTLIISDESLYIQGETSITALRASDGALLWQHAIQRDGPGAPRAIAVADGLLYLPMGEHQVCALRAADGTDAWCASLDTADPIYSLVADTMGAYALTYNDSHDETSGREELIALRAANGGIMWKQSLLGRLLPARANFTAQHGLVYLTTTAEKQYTFTAFQHDTGAVRWATNSYDNPVVAVQDDVVYLGSATRGAQPLQARDASTGALLWNWAKKFSYEKPPDAYTDRLITSGGMVYLLDTTHDLYAIRAGDGKMLWEHLQCTNEDDGSDTDTPGATKWCGWGADRQNGGPIVPLALASGG